MKPGRELDALIAEKVMGLKVLKTQDEFNARNPAWEPGLPKTYITTAIWNANYNGTMWGLDTIPAYSTDIAAAWQVVDRLRDSGLKVIISDAILGGGIGSVDGPWAYFGRYGERIEPSAGSTIPEAICLAALKVKGIEV